jgi:metacaspase-1
MAKTALCIGINDYPGTDSDLAGCVNDAKDWADILKARGFSARLLLNRQATGARMREAIKQLLADARSGDSVVIQFSGHGSFVPDQNGDEPDGTDECLVPYDVRRNGPITDDELFEILSDRAKGVKLIMVSDSCHSGSVAKFAPSATPSGGTTGAVIRTKTRFLPPGAFLGKRDVSRLGVKRAIRRSSPPGRYAALLMSGCQDVESSWDAYFKGRPNGAFTFLALRALKRLPKNAQYQRWYKEIRKVLPSQQYPQTPNLYGTRSMKKWKALV